MLEITLSNGRTIQVIGMAAQHRRLLSEILNAAGKQAGEKPATAQTENRAEPQALETI